MNNRLLYIDQLKGIAIFLVVFGHSIQNNTVESRNASLFEWIYSFHMPLFMFISGYIAQKTTKINSISDYFIFLKKRSISLLIPYFIWPLFVLNFFFKKSTNVDMLDKAWELITGWNPLWYLKTLFFLMLTYSVFYLLSNKLNRKNIIFIDVLLVLAVIAILAILNPLRFFVSENSFFLYFIFFSGGVFISKYIVLSKLMLKQHVFTISLIIFIVLSGWYDYTALTNQNKIIKVIVAVSAIASLYYIVQKIKWHPGVDKYVQLWGKNTIVIYTTHFTINWFFKGVPLFSNLGLISLVIVNAVCSVIVITACMLIFKIVKLSPLLNFLLYGHQAKAVEAKRREGA